MYPCVEVDLLTSLRHIVVWVAVPELRALGVGAGVVPDQTLQSLEEFRPEEWGLPPYDK